MSNNTTVTQGNKITISNHQLVILPPTNSPQFSIQVEKYNKTTEWSISCTLLLDKLKEFEHCPENYRLEIRYDDTTDNNNNSRIKPKIVMNLDPCFWFRYVLEKDKRLEVARNWVDSIRYSKQQHVQKYYETDKEQGPVISVGKYCEFGPNCKYQTRCYKKHSDITCLQKIEKRDQSVEHCGFYAFKELVIENLHPSEKYTIMAKVKGDRELLVLPRDHLTNKELIVKSDFWRFIFELQKALVRKSEDPCAVEYVACNFGEWETKLSQDNLSKECHAHIHIGLSKNAQKNLAKLYPQLNQRVLDPPDYAIDNIDYLERHYLIPEENRQLRQMLASIKTEAFHS